MPIFLIGNCAHELQHAEFAERRQRESAIIPENDSDQHFGNGLNTAWGPLTLHGLLG